MIKASLRTLSRKLSERDLFAGQIEEALGTREPERAEAMLKEKAPFEVLRILEKANSGACSGYKNIVRGARRRLDTWETAILGAAILAIIFAGAGIVLTLLRLWLPVVVLAGLSIVSIGVGLYLYVLARRLRNEIERYLRWQDEHCRDARILSQLASATSKIGVDEAHEVIKNLLFSEEA
jgi:hypothetical protein